MSTRSLARCVLLSSVVVACGGHSAHGASTTTSSDAGAADAGTSDARPTGDASSAHDRPATGDAGTTTDAGEWPEGGAPDCPIPSAATALSGCAALYVECISVAIDCTCTATQYQMLCQPTAVPPSTLGCSAQPSTSAQAPAYCCPCGSDDGGAAANDSAR